MKKMTLELDELEVESFATSHERMPSGTVAAYASTGCGTDDACCWAHTAGDGTCETTCNQINCGCSLGQASCYQSCYLGCETYGGEGCATYDCS